MAMATTRKGTEASALRELWGENLRVHLGEEPGDVPETITRKELRLRLAKLGYQVSRQSVANWAHGEVAPRPEIQVAIARALGVSARGLFPLLPVSKPVAA